MIPCAFPAGRPRSLEGGPRKARGRGALALLLGLLGLLGCGSHPAPAPAAPTFQVTFAAEPGGRLEGILAQTVPSGGASTPVTAVAEEGSLFSGWTGSGFSSTSANPLTVSAVSRDLSLAAHFTPRAWSITATAGAGGSVSPSGTIQVAHGADATFAITPGAGYRVAAVRVDGASAGAVASYTFTRVTASHALAAAFSPAPTHALSVSLGAGVTGAPAAGSPFSAGTVVPYSYGVQGGYTDLAVTLDGAPVPVSGSVTMDGPHALAATAAPVPPPTGRHPRFLGSPAWQAQWVRARAENHPWWQRIQAKADAELAGAPDYGDDGIFGAIAYRVTGDARYAVASYQTVLHQIGADTGGLGLVNQFESQFLAFDAPAFVLVYDWICEGLDATRRAAFRDELVGIGDLFLHGTVASGKDFWLYMRIPNLTSQYCADSDQSSYVYWTLALLDQALAGESPRAGTFLAASTKDIYGYPMGVGLDDTGTGGPAPASPATLRDAIADYARVSSGGAWLEGCEYDRETLHAVILAWQAMKEATGQEHFPEYARLMPELGSFLLHEMSPDLRMSLDWGDNEEPRTMSVPWTRELMIWGGVMMLASGANRGTLVANQLNQVIQELGDAYPDTMMRPMSGIGLLGYYPYDPKADWRGSLPRGALAAGMGQFRYHTGWTAGDSWLGAALYTRTGADHEMGHFTDVQLYRKGEWVLTSPQGYLNGVYEMHNGMGIGGEGSMYQRGPVAAQWSDRFAYVAGTTRGTPDALWVYDPRPASFCAEWTRSLFYLPTPGHSADSLVIHDRVDSPQGREWVLHTPVAATLAPGTAAWTTPLTGQKVRLTLLSPASPGVTTYPDLLTGYVDASELRYTLKAVPSVHQDWDTWLNVVDVFEGTAPVVTRVVPTAGAAAEGVLLVRAGEPDALVLFSAVRGARILTAGYTFSYTGVAATADLHLLDLDPALAWTATLDGRPAALVLEAGGLGTGVASLAVAGPGPHTVILASSAPRGR